MQAVHDVRAYYEEAAPELILDQNLADDKPKPGSSKKLKQENPSLPRDSSSKPLALRIPFGSTSPPAIAKANR